MTEKGKQITATLGRGKQRTEFMSDSECQTKECWRIAPLLELRRREAEQEILEALRQKRLAFLKNEKTIPKKPMPNLSRVRDRDPKNRIQTR